MAENLFGNAVPALGDAADGTTNYALGTRFTSSVSGSVTHGRWRFPSTIPHPSTQVQIGVYRVSDQVLLGSASFPLGSALGAWNEVAFPSPVAVSAGVAYAVVVWTPLRYVATANYPWPATSTNLTAAAANSWLAVNPGGLAFPAAQSGNSASYFADVVFEPGGGGGASVAPDGVPVAVALGAPALAWSGTAAPDGLAVSVAAGAPIVGAASVNPDGMAVPVGLGGPTLGWSGSVVPDGLPVAVSAGSPIVGVAPVAPDGLSVPVAVGAPALAWSGSVSPDGLSVPVVAGAVGVRMPGTVVVRPFTGTVARPSAGIVVRPDTGVVSRP